MSGIFIPKPPIIYMEDLNIGLGSAKKPVPEALPMEDIYRVGNRYEDPRDRTLFFFCYLTGARISEALASTPQDMTVVKSDSLGDYITVRLLTRKNKRIPFRDVPVPMKHREKNMVDYIYSYMEIETQKKTDRIFNHLTRTNAWNRLTKNSVRIRAIHGKAILDDHEQRVNPHYLRHCRLTHLVQHYGFNDIQLMRFAGWSNTKPATVYVHLNWMDLARVMNIGQEQNPFLWE